MSERKEAKEREGRSLQAWRPFGGHPFGEMERWPSLWEGVFPGFGGRHFADLFREFPSALRSGAFVPAVDLVENHTHYTITIEIPGVKKDDVHVELQDDTLVIHGEKKSEREDKERGRYLERSYGAFSRAFTLPSDADGERLEASFKEGILSIRIPRREAIKPKQIAIKS